TPPVPAENTVTGPTGTGDQRGRYSEDRTFSFVDEEKPHDATSVIDSSDPEPISSEPQENSLQEENLEQKNSEKEESNEQGSQVEKRRQALETARRQAEEIASDMAELLKNKEVALKINNVLKDILDHAKAFGENMKAIKTAFIESGLEIAEGKSARAVVMAFQKIIGANVDGLPGKETGTRGVALLSLDRSSDVVMNIEEEAGQTLTDVELAYRIMKGEGLQSVENQMEATSDVFN